MLSTQCMKACINRNISLAVVLTMQPLTAIALPENNEARALISATSALHTDTLHTEPMSGGYLVQLVTGLFIVLLCIVVLAWAAKKLNRFRFVPDNSLKIIGGLNLGARERVVLMQVGKEQLLIGVSPGRINTLHKLDTPLETTRPEAGNTAESSFSNKLKTAMAGLGNQPGKQRNES